LFPSPFVIVLLLFVGVILYLSHHNDRSPKTYQNPPTTTKEKEQISAEKRVNVPGVTAVRPKEFFDRPSPTLDWSICAVDAKPVGPPVY
jgi:hypothetical protein